MTENDKKAESSPTKDEDNEEANGASGDSHHHDDPLFQSEEASWKTVPVRCQKTKTQKCDPSKERGRGGRGQYSNSRAGRSRGRGPRRGSFHRGSRDGGPDSGPDRGPDRGAYRGPDRGAYRGPDRGPYRGPDRGPGRAFYVEGPGRAGRGQRGRGFDNGPRRPRGRGVTNYQSDASSRRSFDPVSQGFTLKEVRYEKNKLYVLGLHKKTTKDCVLNYIERISGCDVKHVLWFKPNGRAIVTLDTVKITGQDFKKILEEAAKKKLGNVDVVIERAPVCKSIFVRGIPENTPQEVIEKYFDNFGVVEKFVDNTKEVKAQRTKEKRAIVYFKYEKSVWKVVEKDQFLPDGTLLHVERYHPFMGTVEPVDSKTVRHSSSEIPVSEQPYFRMDVDVDTIEFVMGKCNQGLELQDRLSRECAHMNWTNRDGYVLIKYNSMGRKPDDEFDEDVWEKRCREIINDVLDRFTMKDVQVEKEIWEPVMNELPQIEMLFPNFSAQVKQFEDLKELKLICPKKDLPRFEKKLLNKLKEIKQTELEKTLDHKTLTDIPNEKLQLMELVGIQDMLKQDVHQDVQAKIDLSKRSIFIKTPEGQMSSAVAYLRKRDDEIDQNSSPNPPEIIEILKTKVGKRKLKGELREASIACSFNVDENNNKVLFLGKTLSDTVKGRKLAETVLVTGKLGIKDRDNNILLSDEWIQLCRDFEKRLKVRCERRLMEFHVFGLKKDVDEAVKEMRKFLNEKNAKEGEFRFDSSVKQRFFHEFYMNDEIKKLEESLSPDSVNITPDENGDLFFTGTVEGVKEVTEKLNALQDDIKEKTQSITLPGMRSFLAKDKGELIGAVEREHRCVIEIKETTEKQQDDEDDSDELSSLSDHEEDVDEDDETIGTPEGKKVIWKLGNIEEEEADILVCSVGSNLNLSIGAIARAMSQLAGPALQDALIKATANNHLRPGEVVHTIPGNLPCNHAVFCVCCPWDDGRGDAKQILQTLLWKCFDEASQLGWCSIALPLIGTGTLNFPHDVAVQVMVDEAIRHSNTYPNSPIEEFRFIVHGEDKEGISAFEEKFRHFKEENQRRCLVPRMPQTGHTNRRRKETPIFPGPRCTKVLIGDVAVEVVKGDITKESSDGIISLVREDLQMKHGNLSAAIANASGNAVQEELTAKFPHPSGSAVTTSAGDMAANCIIHMVVASGNKRHLLKCVQAALKEAHSMDLKSVSIPAIGSGGLGLSPRDSAEVVLGAVCAFFETMTSRSTVREVRVVVLEESVMCAFANRLTRMETEPDQASDFTGQDDNGDEEEAEIGAKLTSGCFQHRVTVYGRHEVLEKAITALKNGVIDECHSIVITEFEDVISRLPKRCKRDLRQKAREEDVGLDLSKQGAITLKGFSTDVIKMHTEVSKVLQDRLKDEHKMDRAEMTSRNVQWCYLSVTGKQEPFVKMANYDIETAFQSKKSSVSFTHKNMQAEIIFDVKKVTFVKTGAVKHIFRREVVPLPHEWDDHPQDAKGRDERVHLVRLEMDSTEYQGVQDKFMKSVPDHEKVSITSIQRVQNPAMYRSYVTKKQSMDEKNANHKNEWNLFHGTGYHNVKDISAHGFNRSFCGRNGASYGDGVYFATKSSYSLSFVKPPNAKGEYCMYLAKVLVGKYTVGLQYMKTPPPIDPDRRELLYDSVVDSTEDPTMFVIFHDDQCYPEYLVTFTR